MHADHVQCMLFPTTCISFTSSKRGRSFFQLWIQLLKCVFIWHSATKRKKIHQVWKTHNRIERRIIWWQQKAKLRILPLDTENVFKLSLVSLSNTWQGFWSLENPGERHGWAHLLRIKQWEVRFVSVLWIPCCSSFSLKWYIALHSLKAIYKERSPGRQTHRVSARLSTYHGCFGFIFRDDLLINNFCCGSSGFYCVAKQ